MGYWITGKLGAQPGINGENLWPYICLVCAQEVPPSEEPGACSRVSVEQLLEQLQITQTELENVRVSRLSLHKPDFSFSSSYYQNSQHQKMLRHGSCVIITCKHCWIIAFGNTDCTIRNPYDAWNKSRSNLKRFFSTVTWKHLLVCTVFCTFILHYYSFSSVISLLTLLWLFLWSQLLIDSVDSIKMSALFNIS